MDFTPELSAFQGVIISADNVHQFSSLASKGGNEDKVRYILACMLKFLKEENFIKNGITDLVVSKVRKFAMYIVLNADLPVLEELVELEGIDMVIWTIPTIPKYLMTEMLWNLHMEQFVYEIISFSYPQLGLEVAGAFIDNFKYFQPTECLEKLKKLSSACYLLICNLHCFQMENEKLINMLTIAFDNFQKCLRYFITPPNNYKLNTLRIDELYRYQGNSLYALFLMSHKCFSQFTQIIDPNSCDNLYKLTYKEGYMTDIPTFNICDSPNNLILECLTKCNTVLLDTCKVLVMDVSIDVFCSWSEFEENGKSMQQTIGELCDMLRTILLNIETVCEHPLVGMIQQIARKPTVIKDIVNTIDSKSIIDNINRNDEDRLAWLHALLFKDQLCQHKDLIDIIDSNLDVFNEDDCYKLYHIFRSHHTNSTDNSDYVQPILVKVFHRCKISDRHKILEETFSNNCFYNMTEDTKINDSMTEIFNKLVASSDADLTVVLTVFLQNPRQVYTKIFQTATENTQQADIMLKVMEILSKYSNSYYTSETEPCIISVTKNIFENYLNSESQQDNFIKFICGLKYVEIIPGTKLLLLIVMPNMHKALLSKNIIAINVQIRLLREAYEIAELLDCRAPMLAMLAQVMDVVRWRNLTVFIPTAPQTLHLTLQLQTSLVNTYNNKVPDKESKWLKSKLKKMHPLNMYYYRILWNPLGKNFFEVISNINVTSETSTSELSTNLAQIISLCTQSEWCELWDSLSTLDAVALLSVFHEAVTMITAAETAHRTEATRACVLYCYRNLIYITRYKFLKKPITDGQVTAALCNIARVLKDTLSSDVEDIGTALMPLLAYLTGHRETLTVDLATLLNNHFKNTNFAEMFSKVFTSNIDMQSG